MFWLLIRYIALKSLSAGSFHHIFSPVCVCVSMSMSLTISLGYVKTSKPQNTYIKYKCCLKFSLSRACFYVSKGFSSLYCCNMVAMFKIETTI